MKEPFPRIGIGPCRTCLLSLLRKKSSLRRKPEEGTLKTHISGATGKSSAVEAGLRRAGSGVSGNGMVSLQSLCHKAARVLGYRV